ncbi:MAG: ATP-binding protein [Sedimentisphaerales bacterium]|nr:ATP-binding protein [Sedimentisphaerales bacterium]
MVNYNFFGEIGRILNSGQSQSMVLTGNIYDLFYYPEKDRYESLLDFLLHKWDVPEARNIIKIVYELNGPINFLHENDKKIVLEAWRLFHTGKTSQEDAIERLARPYRADEDQELSEIFEEMVTTNAISSPTAALEFLRQLCQASRLNLRNNPLINRQMLIIIEGADMILPEGEIARLSTMDRKNVAICRDWFCDPGFMEAKDAVILLTESRAELNREISRLPQLLEVEVPSPDQNQREHYISWFMNKADQKPQVWSGVREFAAYTAGLTLLTMMQLLRSASHTGRKIQPEDVSNKIEEYLISQLGEGVVEFKKPKHTLDDVVGNRKIKNYIQQRFIPRLKKGAIAGAAVGGAIGVGKSFLFEAVAAHLNVPVLVLKNIRSKWFGETDIIFERLRRIVEAFYQVLIFVDEADTQFGGVGQEVHPTERRLTGKIQAMMADPQLKGRVVWLLLTARINLLSEDLLRRGRAGDVIFALTDPEGEDLEEFVNWVLKPVMAAPDTELVKQLLEKSRGYSAADFDSLRADLKMEADGRELSAEQILSAVENRILSDTADFRRAQTLNALIKCTDRRLLPREYDDIESQRKKWKKELAALQAVI